MFQAIIDTTHPTHLGGKKDLPYSAQERPISFS
jgi:hypothetical protein